MNNTIKIEVEVCRSWGYNFKIKQIEEILRTQLNKLGYTLDIKFIPSFLEKSEYYIYLVTDNGRILIFSNLDLHSKEGAIIGTRLSTDNIKQVMEKIVALRQ